MVDNGRLPPIFRVVKAAISGSRATLAMLLDFTVFLGQTVVFTGVRLERASVSGPALRFPCERSCPPTS